LDKRQPQIILKTERTFVLELRLKGKFTVKSTAWDENRVFLRRRHAFDRGQGRR
jgi:hypothetical protein